MGKSSRVCPTTCRADQTRGSVYRVDAGEGLTGLIRLLTAMMQPAVRRPLRALPPILRFMPPPRFPPPG